jgi:hypothetical protein
MADYAKLKEEERVRQKDQTEQFKAMKKENKRLQQQLQDDTKFADQADKLHDEKQKIEKELTDAQIRIRKGVREHEIFELRGQRDDQKAKLAELQMQEIEIKAQLEKNQIGHENTRLEQENKIREARIKAAKKMLESENYEEALNQQATYTAERIAQEEELYHLEQTLKRQRERRDIQSEVEAQKRLHEFNDTARQRYSQEITDEIERTARVQFEHQELRDEYTKIQQTKKMRDRLRVEGEEGRYRLEQLKGEHTYLMRENVNYEKQLQKEMVENAKTALLAEQRSRTLQLQKEKFEKHNQILVADAMLKHIQSPENTNRLAQSEAIALSNQKSEQEILHKKQLKTQIEQHHRTKIGQGVAKYCEENKVEIGEVMNNIVDHIDKIDVPAVVKPYVVKESIDYSHEQLKEVERRSDLLGRIDKEMKAKLSEEQQAWVNTYVDKRHYGDLGDEEDAIHRFDQGRFQALICSYNTSMKHFTGQCPGFPYE